MKTLKLGQIAEIRFLDHCEGSEDGDPIEFVVYGRVSHVSRLAYELTAWGYADNEKRKGDDNETRFSIVRKAIVRIRLLRG